MPHKLPKWVWFVFLFLWLFCLFILGYFLGTGKSFSIPTPRIPSIGFRKHFKAIPAKPDPLYSKTKNITPEGGTISLVDQNGTRIDLIIPANAVDQPTDITMVALPDAPVDNIDVGENSPGVLITPVDVRFNIPAVIVFDFDPADEGALPEMMPLPAGTPDSFNPQIIQPPAQTDLTEDEENRRENSSSRTPGERASVVHTDSSPTESGSVVVYAPSEINSDDGQIQTQADDGGSYNVDPEVTEAEARKNINNVLDNPAATPEQILEAGQLAQAWGFDDLDQATKNKLKEKMNQVSEQINEQCSENKGASKKNILEWQALAQTLGFNEQDQKFQALLESCKGYYSFELMFEAEFEMKYNGSVCGFIDDTWEASLISTYFPPYSGGCWSTKFNFTVPAEGGYSPPTNYDMTCHCCLEGSCGDDTSNLQGISFYYDGVDTIGFPGYATTKINFQRGCQVNDQLPPLEPIPVNNNNYIPEPMPIVPSPTD